MVVQFKDNEEIKTLIDHTIIFDIIYPVGSYYWTSEKNFDPNIYFGKTTWVRIENRFLWANDHKKPLRPDKNEETVTLITDNIPKHSHGMNHVHNKGTMNITGELGYLQVPKGNRNLFLANGAFSLKEGYVQLDGWKGDAYIGSSVRLNAANAWTGTTSIPMISKDNPNVEKLNTDSVGQSNPEPINIMPPYRAAYCWHRIK